VFPVGCDFPFLTAFLATPTEKPQAGSGPMNGRSTELPFRCDQFSHELTPISVYSVMSVQLHEGLVAVPGQF
jgi:hypothetical protein